MELEADFLGRIDVRAAVEKAAPARGEFFPSRLEAAAAMYSVDAYGNWIEAQLAQGYDAPAPETVWVPRSSPGYRPVPHLGFAERVVFAALEGVLAADLAPEANRLNLRSLGEPDEGARVEFERTPLDQAEAKYVALADVASCYEYLDHDRLSRDIVDLTGDIELADAIRDLLSLFMQRGFGVPQGPRPSDLLADVYLSAVDRDLARSGVESWRFNDDFLLAAESEAGALLLLRILESSLRDRGLVLNHQKSRIANAETYEGWIDALAEALAEVSLENVDTSFYSFDPDSFADMDIEDLDLEVAETLFSRALEGDLGDSYNESDRVIQQTLPVLAKEHSVLPMQHLKELATRWRAHARYVSLYLREFIGTELEEEMVRSVTRVLVLNLKMVPWVRGWLLDPIARCDVALQPKKAEGIFRRLLEATHEPWFVRGRAAIVLGQRRKLPPQVAFLRVFESAPPGSRVDLVAAVRIAEPEWAAGWLRGIGPEEPLARIIAGMDSPAWAEIL